MMIRVNRGTPRGGYTIDFFVELISFNNNFVVVCFRFFFIIIDLVK